ncbi:MAG: hypothetical protein IPN61_01005 [Bacteroidetes bacterium]|nr:hypothetical protein [Bacteroidota bacterium]
MILDLRDNQGGELTYGKLLVSHLIDKPFSLIESYYKVNSSGGKYELKRPEENLPDSSGHQRKHLKEI